MDRARQSAQTPRLREAFGLTAWLESSSVLVLLSFASKTSRWCIIRSGGRRPKIGPELFLHLESNIFQNPPKPKPEPLEDNSKVFHCLRFCHRPLVELLEIQKLRSGAVSVREHQASPPPQTTTSQPPTLHKGTFLQPAGRKCPEGTPLQKRANKQP